MTYRVSGDPSKPRSWSKYANDSSSKKTKEDLTNAKSSKRFIDSVENDDTEDTETKKCEKKKKRANLKENEQVKKALEKVRNAFALLSSCVKGNSNVIEF